MHHWRGACHQGKSENSLKNIPVGKYMLCIREFWMTRENYIIWKLRFCLCHDDFDSLVQERRNSSVLAVELRLSCTNPLIWPTVPVVILSWDLPLQDSCAVAASFDTCILKAEHQEIISASLLFNTFMKDVRICLLELNIIYEGHKLRPLY